MRYLELCYALPAETAELAVSALVDCGAGGIEERDATTIERAAPGRSVLVTWIDEAEGDRFVERAARALEALGVDAADRRPRARTRDEDEWRDAWKRWFHARPIGRFVLLPSWERYAPAPDQLVIDLDPGRAFGTGGHASTRLCLRAIDDLHARGLAPSRVLDVGCGSGVLSIAAMKRWPAARGEGVDVDPDAILVSRENATRNGVADRMRYSTTPIAEVPIDDHGRAGLILANIQPEILVPMAPALQGRLDPRGALVLAGIIDEAADEVAAAYAALGEPQRLVEEGWTALVYREDTRAEGSSHARAEGSSDPREKRAEGGGSSGSARRGGAGRPPIR